MKALTKDMALMFYITIDEQARVVRDNLVFNMLKGEDMSESAIETVAKNALHLESNIHFLIKELPSEIVERVKDAEKQRMSEMVPEWAK